MADPVFRQHLPFVHHGDDMDIVIAGMVDNPPSADTDFIQFTVLIFRHIVENTYNKVLCKQGYFVEKGLTDFLRRGIYGAFFSRDDPANQNRAPAPNTNLFHRFGCGAADSVIDWVMKTQSVSLSTHSCY